MKKNQAVLVVAVLVGLAGLLWWQAGTRPSELPDFDSAAFTYIAGRDEVPPLKISGADVGNLRALFEEIPADRRPAKWQVLGHLKLMKEGRVVQEIQVFSNSNGPGPFRVSEKRYFLGYDQHAFRKLPAANGWQPE